jgi:hypothetical protein
MQFSTGMNRIPLDGFDPPFQINQSVDESPNALPVSHTCFNMFVVPDYQSYQMFKEKVLFAIMNTDSFELA